MANLTEVVEQLKVQNNTLESVNSTVVGMLKEDIAARKATERGKGKAEEDRRERAKVRNQPKSIVGGFKQGATEGLGLGALSGLLGLMGGGLATIFKALVPGFVAAATTKSILTGAASLFGKLLGRGLLVGIFATWGQTIFKKFLDSIDPEDGSIFDLTDEAKTKFAGLLNFATIGLLVAGLFGKLISFKFRALLAGGIVVGGFLYNALMDKLDGSVLEEKFNENFNFDFGAEIMSGIGALVGVALSGAVLNTIRKRLGLNVRSVPTPKTGSARPGYIPANKFPKPANINAPPGSAPPAKGRGFGNFVRGLTKRLPYMFVMEALGQLANLGARDTSSMTEDEIKDLFFEPDERQKRLDEISAQNRRNYIMAQQYHTQDMYEKAAFPPAPVSPPKINGALVDRLNAEINPKTGKGMIGQDIFGPGNIYTDGIMMSNYQAALAAVAESAAVSAAAAIAAAEKVAAPDRSVANAGFSGGREAAIGNTSDNNDKFHEALGIE